MDEGRRQRAFYLCVGLAGEALIAAACALGAGEAHAGMRLVGALLGALVILVWMIQGLKAVGRHEQERAQARVRAEAQEAARRVAQQVNARRTVSHGGMTINVRRAAAHRNNRGEASS